MSRLKKPSSPKKKNSADAPLQINGSYGEGGGALLRMALAVATLTQRPVKVHNIRGAMRKPGINSEDLTFIRALAKSCNAELVGDELGETELVFNPHHSPRCLHQKFDLGEHEKGAVPGNALIIMESLLPVLARTGGFSRIVVHGETYNPNTLTFDAFERVTLRAHQKQSLYAYAHQAVAGFGFAAKGEVVLEVEPSATQGLNWVSRGSLRHTQAVIVTADLSPDIADRGAAHAQHLLNEYNFNGEVEVISVNSRAPGIFITFLAEFENGLGCGTAMGQRGVRMERVVEQAFQNFMNWYSTDATADPFLADQLLLPAVLAEEPTFYKTNQITQRLVTLAWVIKQFIPARIRIEGRVGEPGSVQLN